MAYATVDQLAAALRTRVTAENTADLQRCIDAAAYEIDAFTDRVDPIDPLDVGAMALAASVNIVRGVEWWKANDAAFGVIGTDETGVLRAPKDPFGRHTASLVPLKQRWGVG